MADKISTLTLAELEARAASLTRYGQADEANNLMAYAELRRMLVANAERDLVLLRAEMRIDRLEAIASEIQDDRDEARVELAALRRDHEELRRMQADLHARQGVLAAVMEVGVNKIAELAAQAEALAESVAGQTEP